jgi:hypothetical protein
MISNGIANRRHWLGVALIGCAGIALATGPWAGVCGAADVQIAAPTDKGLVFNSTDGLTDEAFPDLLISAPDSRSSAFYLDDAASQPEFETKAEAESSATLAKKTLNPVSDLISVPFQYNADFDIGPSGATRSLLNIQPVIPVSISDDYNLIIRTIVPVISIGSVADGVSSQSGLGDTVQSFFISPKQKIGGWILGAGPVFLWPTATADALGSGKFGMGPTGVVLRQDGPWTYGVLANQIWSYAGDDYRTAVNSLYMQPFIAYTFPTYTSIGINTETTYGWENHQTSIPINLTLTQILKLAGQPISLQVGPRYYAKTVPGGPYWGLRFTFTLLLPK